MDGKKIGYWVATGLVEAELLVGGVWNVMRGHHVLSVVERLGYPSYVLTILGIGKLLAAPALLVPGLPHLREWAYAGFFFEMAGAAASHAACGDQPGMIAPLVLATLTLVSWGLHPRTSAA
jgi:hypothetical protein